MRLPNELDPERVARKMGGCFVLRSALVRAGMLAGLKWARSNSAKIHEAISALEDMSA